MDATDLAFAGIAKQAELIAAGEISSRELVDLYLERIARFDPQLNAFRIVFEERARMEADQADARRRAGSPPAQRPLLGVPIAVKDEIDVAGEVTAQGTNAYGDPKQADGEVVRRLRAAGAVIIGKTTCPSCASGPSPRPPRGEPRATRGTSSAHRAARAVAAPRRWPPAWWAGRWRAMERDRFAYRRHGAGCSA